MREIYSLNFISFHSNTYARSYFFRILSYFYKSWASFAWKGKKLMHVLVCIVIDIRYSYSSSCTSIYLTLLFISTSTVLEVVNLTLTTFMYIIYWICFALACRLYSLHFDASHFAFGAIPMFRRYSFRWYIPFDNIPFDTILLFSTLFRFE